MTNVKDIAVGRRFGVAPIHMIETRSELHAACCLSAWADTDGAAGACFDQERTKRYMLWRTWDAKLPRMVAIMLNPSIADEQQLDPTLRRVYGFANSWGFGGMLILNCFANVSTDPKALKFAEIVDEKNDAHIITAVRAKVVTRVMVGWGANLGRKELAPRRAIVDAILRDHAGEKVMAWKITGGQPGHPLYLPADIQPVRYEA